MTKSQGSTLDTITNIVIILVLIALVIAVGLGLWAVKKHYDATGQLDTPLDDPDEAELNAECPPGHENIGEGHDCEDYWGCCIDGYACGKIGLGYWRCDYIFPTCTNQMAINLTAMQEEDYEWSDVEASLSNYEKYYGWYTLLNTGSKDYAYEKKYVDSVYTWDYPCECGDGSQERNVLVDHDTITGNNPTTYYTGQSFWYRYCAQLTW